MGMGLELYKASRGAREIFDAVDDCLSFRITEIMFNGPASELGKTINAQPAIMAVSLASLAALGEWSYDNNLEPSVFAGHSLGEYTALVASGAVDLIDGVRLVKERGALMQMAAERQEGGMAAIIGLDENTLQEVCRETGTQIANINTRDQVVISGNRIALERAMDSASRRGARKTIQLAVAGAFHSQLMAPAQRGLVDVLDDIGFKEPKAPIVANFSAEMITTRDEIRQELVSQLCNCVLWRQSVECMINMGILLFVEFGPGKVLNSLVKRIDRQAKTANVDSPSAARQLAEQTVPLYTLSE